MTDAIALRDEMRQGFAEMRHGFARVDQGMAALRQDTAELRQGVTDLRQGVTELQEGFGALHRGMAELARRVEMLERRERANGVMLETLRDDLRQVAEAVRLLDERVERYRQEHELEHREILANPPRFLPGSRPASHASGDPARRERPSGLSCR